MKKVSVLEIISKKVSFNEKILIQGWIRTRRDSKSGISFLNLYDGSCFQTIQVIAKNSLSNYNTEIIFLTTGCSVSITGILSISPNISKSFEIIVHTLQVIGWVKNSGNYPISPKKHSLEYLREVAHLRPRTNLIGSISRIRHTLIYTIHSFLNRNEYYWISTPLITSSNTEGAGEIFYVSTKRDIKKPFFGKKEVFLTVSGQLNAEAYACALSKVYTFGPVFRAENSNTSRHLAEFWMLEVEAAFYNLNNIIQLIEKMLKYSFKKLLKERWEDLNYILEKVDKNIILRIEKFISNSLIQIEYTDAINILIKSKKVFKNKVHWGIDLLSEHERFLVDFYFKNPIVIKNYPKRIKPFYMRLNDDKKTVSSMDILFPKIGEVIGGSEREERLDFLDNRIKEMNLKKKDYWWYRDLRKYGTVFHSGFGLGFERLISFITGVKNLRDIIPFPRTPNKIDF